MKLHVVGNISKLSEKRILRITTKPVFNIAARRNYAYLCQDNSQVYENINDYGALLLLAPDKALTSLNIPVVTGIKSLDYLSDDDVISIHPDGVIRTLYRRESKHNFILMTAQCNSFCLMCSQPPLIINDFNRVAEHLRLIELINLETDQLGITGGEPTLFKDDFLRVISHCKEKLPYTRIHVLTNGRMFYYRRFAENLGIIEHPNLMLGIPLYSDVDSHHDYVVQAKGAFDETVIGLNHLAMYNVSVEIRVVLHEQTISRLPQLAEFIARNFPFAGHVALMGLEMFGFVHRNIKQIWIDPHDYQEQLKEAVKILAFAGLNVSIYNHQLCVLDHELWQYAQQSISDWKNIYLPECENCSVRNACGGLFQSAAKKHSQFIKAL